KRWFFDHWSTTSDLTFELVNPQEAKKLEATYVQQNLLTVNSKPAAGGTVAGLTGEGWYEAHQSAQVQAVANPGFVFTGFTGSVTSSQPSIRVDMPNPATVTANFISAGTPVLRARTGARSDVSPGVRRLQVLLYNAGQFPATSTRIRGIGP